MSVLTSLAVPIVNIGIIPNFFQKWFDIFLITFAIGFPITIAVTPFIRNIAVAEWITPQEKRNGKKIH
jgi:hypothetical protein